MSTREELDQLGWHIIDSQPQTPFESAGLANSGLPRSFPELEIKMQMRGSDFDCALSSFLHEFYQHRDQRFFVDPPSQQLEPINRTALAGIAEYLSNRFHYPIPEWTRAPEFHLPEEHDWFESQFDKEFLATIRDFHVKDSAPEFMRRNLIFSARGLIHI